MDKDDEAMTRRESSILSLCTQYTRYLLNALANVGGIYLTEVKDGTPGNVGNLCPEIQQKSLLWVIKQIRNSDWLDQHELTRRLPLALSKIYHFKRVLEKLLELNNGVLLSSHVSMQPYCTKDYYDDLYTGIWGPTIQRSSFDRRR